MSGGRDLAGGSTARYLLLFAVLALLFGGLVMVYSASSVMDLVVHDDGMYHFKRQALWIGAGLVAMLVMSMIDYRVLRKVAWPYYFISLGGLLAVLAFGTEKWGAKRWLIVGGMTIQPSEYAKLACLLLTAVALADARVRGRMTHEQWTKLGLAVGAVMVLVMIQPDMGTTVSIAAAVFLVLVLGGVNGLLLSGVVGGGALLGALAIFTSDYRTARFFAFLDPWKDAQGDGYQTVQAIYAFASGGLGGTGLGMSRQKFFYLPAAHTDFIFAIIGEEFGLIGTLAVVAAFIVFAYAGFRIALGARDRLGRLLAGGITAMIVTQAIINMAAVTGLVPVTGIPMPLVSSGGSSMTFTLACVGIVLSVSTFGSRGVRLKRGPVKPKETSSAGLDERRRDRRTHLSGIDGGRRATRKRA